MSRSSRRHATGLASGGGMEWHVGEGKDRNQWLQANPKEGSLAARIKQLDKATFACYRDGKYLGCEATLELAFARVKTNTRSETNREMEWQKSHPDEQPLGLRLTDTERAKAWADAPPAQATRVTSRGAAPRQGEDLATSRLRAELAAEGRRKVAGAPKDRADPPVAGRIVVANSTNPKKAGTGAHKRWALLFSHDGKTVAEYVRARGNVTTLANAMAKGNVRVEEK